MPTAPRRRLLTAAGWLVAIVISFPFVALLESLQLDGTDQAPGTPSMAQVIVGAFAIVPLPVLCGVILKRYDEAAKLLAHGTPRPGGCRSAPH